MRIYNPQIGKFLSVDPISNEYPELTPFQFASNRPIEGIDLDGLEFWGVSVPIEVWTTAGEVSTWGGRTISVPVEGINTIPIPPPISKTSVDYVRKNSIKTNRKSQLTSNKYPKQQKSDANKIKEKSTSNDATKNRVKLRKDVKEKIKDNQPKNEKGEPIDPNDRKPIGDDKTDIGHKTGQEWHRRKEMHNEKGSSRKEVIEEENNPDLYQIERRSNNRSHKYEKPRK